MSAYTEFLQNAKDDYDRVEADLEAYEKKVKEAGDRADSWTKDQVEKLKTDLADARETIAKLADRIDQEGDEAVTEAHDHAKRHWNALNAAVSAYRDHLEKTVSA